MKKKLRKIGITVVAVYNMKYLAQLFSCQLKKKMNIRQIYSDLHDVSSAIIFLQNKNIIYKIRTCDSGHEMVLDT